MSVSWSWIDCKRRPLADPASASLRRSPQLIRRFRAAVIPAVSLPCARRGRPILVSFLCIDRGTSQPFVDFVVAPVEPATQLDGRRKAFSLNVQIDAGTGAPAQLGAKVGKCEVFHRSNRPFSFRMVRIWSNRHRPACYGRVGLFSCFVGKVPRISLTVSKARAAAVASGSSPLLFLPRHILLQARNSPRRRSLPG